MFSGTQISWITYGWLLVNSPRRYGDKVSRHSRPKFETYGPQILIIKFVLNISIMTTSAIREKLYDYIRVADEEKVGAIYTLLKDQLRRAADWSEDREFVAELDERRRRYEGD